MNVNVVEEQQFPLLQTLKKLRIFQANRCNRRATISPASNAKKNYVYFKLIVVVGEQ